MEPVAKTPQRSPNPSVDVADQAAADELCDAAGEEWPDEWADEEEAVTLDIPNDDSDTVCVRP